MTPTIDPALGFWLRYAEAEGALHEQLDGTTTMLLPLSLQQQFDLPEQLAVTADPEVAREDGALLMAPGHPVLDAAAGQVLDRGDVGRVTLAWPAGGPLSGDALVQRIREQVVIDHGRIDATTELPSAGYLPVLRVGALVGYAVTLDDRFQERQEVWVDATTSLAVPAVLASALTLAAVSEVVAHRVLSADREAAAAAAQVLLEQGADKRLAALGRQSRGAQEAEVARIEAYYGAALESLTRRRAAAPAERQALLDARAEATRAERHRRLSEVEEKFRGSVETRWFRVHELLVPSMTVPVTVRRGAREYPFAFRWLLHQHTVAPVCCPHCAAGAPLVAGKDRLGCERCLSRPTPTPPPAPAARPTAAPRVDRPADARPAGRAAKGPDRSAAVTPIRPIDAKRLVDDGNKLVLKFWQDVARGDRRVARLILPDSPAAAAVRVWGPQGPAFALGMPASEQANEVDVRSFVDPESTMQLTAGRLISDRTSYAYTLRWQGGAGHQPAGQVAEVIGGQTAGDARLSSYLVPPWWLEPSRIATLPPLRIDLDPVAAALWRVELTRRGIPLLLRCLASWWRAAPALADLAVLPLAAAMARAVAGAAGTQLTIDASARQYDADPAAVRAAGGQVRRVLGLSAQLGW